MIDKSYVAVNRRSECGEDDCFYCPYFDHDGNCLANDKLMGCDFCRTAFSDERLDKGQDFSAGSIGKCDNGFCAYIIGTASFDPPVEIRVSQWNAQHKRNHDIFHFTPKYCPMCGRLIVENGSYLHSVLPSPIIPK